MHSSRMHTASSSSHLLGGVCLSACWDTPGVCLETPWCEPGDHPGVGLEIPWVLAWRPSRCGPGDPWLWAWRTPPCQIPELPPQLWAWKPSPEARPRNFPLDVGLDTCNACWDTTHTHFVNRITATCKNITFPHLRLRAVMNDYIKTYLSNVKATKFHVEDTSRPHSGKLVFHTTHSKYPRIPECRM